jgi:hypothetical protein
MYNEDEAFNLFDLETTIRLTAFGGGGARNREV